MGSRYARFSLLIRMSLRTHGRELFPSHCSTGSNNCDEEKNSVERADTGVNAFEKILNVKRRIIEIRDKCSDKLLRT
jgi:hypothetical protein